MKRINFCFRTSFAGCDVPKKVERSAMLIAKKYRMTCEGSSDKSVDFSMLEDAFQKMRGELCLEGLGYLVEVEGEDYNVLR